MYIAIIGDIVKSRKMFAEDRRQAQDELTHTIETLNSREILVNSLEEINRNAMLGEDIESDFLITLGDEFQGLLSEDSNPLRYIRYFVARTNSKFQLRFGIGYGDLTIDQKPVALAMDGTCWHNARDAIQFAKDEGHSVAVKGFFAKNGKCKSGLDSTINTMLDNYFYLYNDFTDRQRKIYNMRYFWGKAVAEIQEEFGYKSDRSIYKELAKKRMKLAVELEIALADLLQLRDPSLPRSRETLEAIKYYL